MFSPGGHPGGRPSLLGSLNRSVTNHDRSDSPISATSPYSNRFHGDTRMLGTATIPSITGNHYLNPNNQRNQAITNSMNTHMPIKNMIKVRPRANQSTPNRKFNLRTKNFIVTKKLKIS